jgi:hypothetical protein
VSSRPFTLAERLALLEAAVTSPAGSSPEDVPWPSAPGGSEDDTVALLEGSFAALELALEDPEQGLAAQQRAARRHLGDRRPLRAGLVLRAEAILRGTMEAVRAEVERRIALRSAEGTRLLLAWDEDVGPFLPRAERARLETLAAGAPSLPSMRGVPGDYGADPPDPWEHRPDPDDDEAYQCAVEDALGILDARRVLALAEDAPAVRAALVRWAEGEGLLGQTRADDFLASDAQVREHLDGHRFDLERLAMARARRDVAFGSVATQLAWGRAEGLLGPRSAALILDRLRLPANHTGT